MQNFYKDGSAVGSIASRGGAVSSIVLDPRTGGGGLGATGPGSLCATTNTGASTTDNVLDLGHSGARWKDVYVGGGVYLGGTGAANKLDDYEEGTWVPTITGATLATDYQADETYESTYTKIGRMVVLEFMVSLSSITSGNYLIFTNLPFTSKSGIWGGGIWTNGWSSEPSGTVRWWNSGTTLHFYESNGSGSVTQLTQGDMGTVGNIFGNIIYYTS